MRIPAALAVVLVLLLSFSPPAHALDEAVPDGDRHPAVGLIGVDPDRDGPEVPRFLCSGAVISDRHFLTAGHCAALFGPDADVFVSLQPGSPAAPVYRPGVYPDEFPFPPTGPVTTGGVVTIHPEFDFDRRLHDVAVVTYPKGTFAGVAPITLPNAGQVDRLRKGRTLRLVGYGVDPEYGNGAPVLIAEGYRQTRTTTLKSVNRRQIELKGGACVGDSGSPQFLGDSTVAISLLSDVGGFDICPGPYLSQRLDTRSERRFLSQFVRLP